MTSSGTVFCSCPVGFGGDFCAYTGKYDILNRLYWIAWPYLDQTLGEGGQIRSIFQVFFLPMTKFDKVRND